MGRLTHINAAVALVDPSSIYHYTRQMLALRKSSFAFIYGTYEDLAPTHPHLFLYTRTLGNEHFLMALNFSRESLPVTWPREFDQARVTLSNIVDTEPQAALRPWEARILSMTDAQQMVE